MTSARISRPCCNVSRVIRLSRCSIWAAGRGVTSRLWLIVATSRSVWTALRASRRWRAPIAVAKYSTVFPQARSAGRSFRRYLRQCNPVSRTDPGAAARIAGTVCGVETARSAFSSNPRADNEQGWSQGRYGTFHDWDAWQRYMCAAGLLELDHYYRPPGLPRNQQPWLASVWRMPS
jgi:hypothetical protein